LKEAQLKCSGVFESLKVASPCSIPTFKLSKTPEHFNLVLNLNLKEAQLKCSGVFESLNVGIEHGEATFNIADPKGTIKSLAADLHFYGLNSPQLPKKLKASSALGSLVVHPN